MPPSAGFRVQHEDQRVASLMLFGIGALPACEASSYQDQVVLAADAGHVKRLHTRIGKAVDRDHARRDEWTGPAGIPADTCCLPDRTPDARQRVPRGKAPQAAVWQRLA